MLNQALISSTLLEVIYIITVCVVFITIFGSFIFEPVVLLLMYCSYLGLKLITRSSIFKSSVEYFSNGKITNYA